jgi:hypothetical protein
MLVITESLFTDGVTAYLIGATVPLYPAPTIEMPAGWPAKKGIQ